jgi:multidrug resistance protein
MPGDVVVATDVVTTALDPRRTRNVILLLAACVALMMTGFGIIMPVFARRLGEFGSGVEALGLMTTSFALAQFVGAPLMGALADRVGRRPLVLLGLAAFAASNLGFLWASSTEAFIAVRTLEGALSSGLFPASMAIVADLVPGDQRARWIGIVMGSYGAGFVFGPTLGGVLYDGWGFQAPFIVSAALALAAFVAATIIVPETRTPQVRQREELRRRRANAAAPLQTGSPWDSLPRPLYVFGTLLFLDFVNSFAFSFVEPQMVFYFYEELDWSTVQFGLVVGAYGLVMVLGQTGLGQLSDRLGRKRIAVLGTLLSVAFYAGLATATTFLPVILTAVVAGLGAALTAPALSAFYLDITAAQHRSRVLGFKGAAASLGSVTGPLLVAGVSAVLTPRGIFSSAGVLVVIGALLALVLLQEPRRAVRPGSRRAVEGAVGEAWQVSAGRAMAAQAALRGVALRAMAARQAHDT